MRIYGLRYVNLIIFFSSTLIFCSPKMYFCTAVNYKCVNYFTNFIGSLFKVNYDDVEEVAVFDIGLTEDQKRYISSIEKVKIYQIDMTHPDILKEFNTRPRHLDPSLKPVPGWYAWKPVMLKQALDMFPYVLLIDSGSTIMNPLNDLFTHIIQNKYLFIDGDTRLEQIATNHVKKLLNFDENMLKRTSLGAGFIGMKRDQFLYDNFVMPMYEFTKDLRNFEDDGTVPGGFGCARHDMPLFSYLAHKLRLKIHRKPRIPILVDGQAKFLSIVFKINFNINDSFTINQSRNNMPHFDYYKRFIRYKS